MYEQSISKAHRSVPVSPMKRLTIQLLVCVLLAGFSNPAIGNPIDTILEAPFHDVVVTIEGDGVPAPLLKDLVPIGYSGRYYRLGIPDGTDFDDYRKELLELPSVVRVEPNYLLRRTRATEFNDPLYASQWYHATLESEVLFELTHGSPEVRVAVIDSAIEVSHPEFADAILSPLDVYRDDADPSPDPGDFCNGEPESICDEHGTAVTGVIAARANNALGIVGFCAQCSIIPIRLVGEFIAPISADLEAFEHAIANDAWVINNSWGYSESIPVSETLKEVIQRASTEPRDGKGAVVVFAAGNDNREIQDFELAAIEEVLSVTATDQFGNPTPYTNTGASVDLSAPSATVSTSINGDYTSSFGGTSAAAPVVAGIASLVLSARPELSSKEVRDLLKETAFKDGRVQFDADGHHNTFGYGFVDLIALRSALEPDVLKSESGCQNLGETVGLLPLICLLLGLRLLNRRRVPNAK